MDINDISRNETTLQEFEGVQIDGGLWSITLILGIFVACFPLISFYLESNGRPAEPNLNKGILLGNNSTDIIIDETYTNFNYIRTWNSS